MDARVEVQIGPQPDQRQIDTVVHGILRNRSVYEKLPIDKPITPDERTSYLQQVADGRIGAENYKTFLGSIKRREHQNDPDELLKDINNQIKNPDKVREHMRKFLSHYTTGDIRNHGAVDATNVRKFITETGKTVLDFEEKRNQFLDIIGKHNDVKKREVYANDTDTLGHILYGKQWEYLQQIRLLEAEAKTDSVTLHHIVLPAIEKPYEEGEQPPPRPNIGTDADWRFVNGEWRLTDKGTKDVPRTEHEQWEQNFLFSPERTEQQRETVARWKFDPAGRPSSMWEGTTHTGAKVSALFEQGAAQRATLRPENEISIDTYEAARDSIAKLDEGLFVFASYINLASPEKASAALSKAVGPNVTTIHYQQVVEYLRQMLPAFGMYKYVQFAGELTMYASPADKEPKEGANRVLNADDILGQWLRQEKQFPTQVRQEGRQMLFAIAQNFERGSQNDSDWTKPNKDVVNLTHGAAHIYRREFSGRYGFGSIWGRLRNDMLIQEEKRGHQIVNPWT